MRSPESHSIFPARPFSQAVKRSKYSAGFHVRKPHIAQKWTNPNLPMKYKSTVDEKRAFPRIDHQFQSNRTPGAGIVRGITPAELRGFRSLSGNFFQRENGRDYLQELMLFGAIAVLSAWPIGSMIAALRLLLK